jgi:NADH:ubiquinone oxidoreductase subunit F (NADH-binding)
MARGGGDGHDAARLARWCAQVRGRGACHHPDGAVRLVSSALAVFADEIAHHGAGRCSGTSGRPVVAVPAAPRGGARAA